MATSTKTEICDEELKCSICERALFEVERASSNTIRLICENCGESYLIMINSENADQLKFIGPEENRLTIF